MIHAIARAVRRLTRRSHRLLTGGLRPAEEIQKLLAVERVRADRTGECLSLVVFEPRTDEAAAATWALLGRVLRGRLRMTDEAGWLDAKRVCAILPFTPAAGGWKVADDVSLLFPDDVPPPICSVMTYPTGDTHLSVPLSDETDGQGRPALAGHNGNGRSGSHGRNGSNGHTNGHGPARRRDHSPAEALFLQPTPILKRTVDVAGAGLGLLVLLPLLPFAAAAIKLSSSGPVFFKQRRAGRGGRPFLMWKFRTMVADAEAKKRELMALNEQDGPAFKIKRDPRITRLGSFLRKTSIDELPQLWNVLKGDMSLVGPRPLPVAESDGCARWQRRRLDVTPGLTCIWQVRGRSKVAFADWVRMDVEYIETRSLRTDLKLILLTVPALLLRKGAH